MCIRDSHRINFGRVNIRIYRNKANCVLGYGLFNGYSFGCLYVFKIKEIKFVRKRILLDNFGMKKIILTIILMVVFFACSSSEPNQIQPVDQVFNNNIIYSMEDFFSAGFKKSKDYDVSELPGAISVTYGFWKTPNKVPVDYEIRIYPSHNEAVNIGSKYAQERSGLSLIHI